MGCLKYLTGLFCKLLECQWIYVRSTTSFDPMYCMLSVKYSLPSLLEFSARFKSVTVKSSSCLELPHALTREGRKREVLSAADKTNYVRKGVIGMNI